MSVIDIKLVTAAKKHLLDNIAGDVFDYEVREPWLSRFFEQGNHYLIVAMEDDLVVGMITSVSYVHPDKPTQLWINEVGVASSHRQQGIGRRLLDAMLAHGKSIGATEAWLGTEDDNVAARRLYESTGTQPEKFMLYEFPLDE